MDPPSLHPPVNYGKPRGPYRNQDELNELVFVAHSPVQLHRGPVPELLTEEQQQEQQEQISTEQMVSLNNHIHSPISLHHGPVPELTVDNTMEGHPSGLSHSSVMNFKAYYPDFQANQPYVPDYAAQALASEQLPAANRILGNNNNNAGLPTAALAGIITGTVAILAVFGALVYIVNNRRSKMIRRRAQLSMSEVDLEKDEHSVGNVVAGGAVPELLFSTETNEKTNVNAPVDEDM